MESLVFTNAKGQSVAFGDAAPYVLYKIENTGGADTDVQLQKSPFQQGKTLRDISYQERPIPVEFVILGENEEDVFKKRSEISAILNPLLGEGKLTYKFDGGEKEIIAVPETSPTFKGSPEDSGQCLNALVTFVSPDPFWMDIYECKDELSYLMGGMQFGLKIPTTFSYRGKKKKVVNSGDVDTPIEIEFYGPGTNPTVANETTGEFIKVKKELADGEILKIDTSFGEKKVEIKKLDGNVENAFGYIDLDSIFWGLAPGDNILSYESLNDSQKAKVKIKFKNRYIAV